VSLGVWEGGGGGWSGRDAQRGPTTGNKRKSTKKVTNQKTRREMDDSKIKALRDHDRAKN